MSLPKEVIVHAMIKANMIPAEAADLISLYELQRNKVAERNRKIQSIKDRAEKEMKEMMSMHLCDHDVTKTHGDPSGGSDSWEECMICGESLARKSVRFT